MALPYQYLFYCVTFRLADVIRLISVGLVVNPFAAAIVAVNGEENAALGVNGPVCAG